MARLALLDALRRKSGQPLRFVMAGAINTAVGIAFYPALLLLFASLRTHYLIALGIAQVSCVLFAYVIYKLTVFRTHGSYLRELPRFVSFYAINYAINWIALPLLVEIGGADPMIAQLGFTVAMVIGSYFWHSRITFKAHEETR